MKIKPINGYTKKDIIWYLITFNDGTQCMDEVGTYVYENSEGNHCAVGCFIPWNHEGMKLEGNVKTLLQYYPVLKKCMPLEVAAMEELQEIHDYTGFGKKTIPSKYAYIDDVRERMLAWVEDNVE